MANLDSMPYWGLVVRGKSEECCNIFELHVKHAFDSVRGVSLHVNSNGAIDGKIEAEMRKLQSILEGQN